jgi:outer membrane protein TolC
MANKRVQISYKATASLNSWRITLDQIELYRQTVIDYNRLLEGERSMFEAGESSLFMVNSREVGYLKARLKLIELMSKNQKARLTANYVYGILNQTL